jgi:alpha-1,6-mannosyltransferase
MALTIDAPVAGLPELRRQRRIGLTGSLLMAIGATGAGALPSPNPLAGVRVLGLPARMMTPSLALVYAGALLLVVAWLRTARIVRHGSVPGPIGAHLVGTAVGWALPLAVAPPLFSRDVYAALAQGAMVARGVDPYTWGPAALGLDDPLVRGVAELWREQPAPYGPLWLLVERVVTGVTGADPVLGVVGHRVVALGGLAAIAWAVPRLAARCGADPTRAFWWGPAHPLAMFHLVSAVHSEALMLGLLLVGLELAARSGRVRLVGIAVLGAAAMIKLPMVVAVAFVGAEWAHRRGGRPRDVAGVAVALLGLVVGVAVVCATAVDLVGGRGWGWLDTLGTPGTVVTWMSVVSDTGLGLSVLTGDPGVLSVARAAGIAVGAVGMVVVLLAALRGRVGAAAGTAAAMGVLLLFAPAVQPWYLLWALLPLAVSGAAPRWAPRLVAAAAVVALVDVPSGDWYFFRGFQLVLGAIGGLAVGVAALLVAGRTAAAEVAPPIREVPAGARPELVGAPHRSVRHSPRQEPAAEPRS